MTTIIVKESLSLSRRRYLITDQIRKDARKVVNSEGSYGDMLSVIQRHVKLCGLERAIAQAESYNEIEAQLRYAESKGIINDQRYWRIMELR